MSIALIILAAGQGRRIGASQNKVWIKVHEKPLWKHCLDCFINYDAITKIYWISSQKDYSLFQKALASYDKVKIVLGGATRQESSYLGAQQIDEEEFPIVLVHDAARAFCSHDIIDRVLQACQSQQAVVPAIPMQDTIRQKKSCHQSQLLDRSTLFAIQTPQGFQTAILKKAHEVTASNQDFATDDASLVEKLGVSVQHVEGSFFNFKVTTHYDLKVAQCFLQNSNSI